MKDARDYLVYIRALIVENLNVLHWSILREEALGNSGLFRYRLRLADGSILEMFERFNVVAGQVQVTKYSFHWQDASGRLRKRWDNAPHHPEVSTHPHHVHDGDDLNVLPHKPMTAEEVLAAIAPKQRSQERNSSPINWGAGGESHPAGGC